MLLFVAVSAIRPALQSSKARPHLVDRRTALQTAAVATVAAVAVPPAGAVKSQYTAATRASELQSGMLWIPKADAPTKSVITSYQPTFVTYLSRFLLNYDRSSATWWRDQLIALYRQQGISVDRQQVRSIREKQFGQFSQSVEVGLQQYQGKKGVRELFKFLRYRYGTSKQAKLQLALLFSIVSSRNQPSDLIRKELARAEGGVVTAAELLDGGRGYVCDGGNGPKVTVSAPDGGGAPAVVRAELGTTGQLLSIALGDGGSGYLPGASPTVSVSPPSTSGGRQAGRRAQAIARVGDGRVVSLELIDRGRGYRKTDVVTVRIEPPRDDAGKPLREGVAATAAASLESGVVRLVLEDGGRGYARDQPLSLDVAPPQLPGGRGAVATLRLAYTDLEALASEGPFSSYYPEDSVSGELLRLLPPTVRPARLQDGNYSFPLAAPSALSEGLQRNGGRSGFDVNMESYLYAARSTSGLRQKLPFAADRDPTFGPLGTSPVVREASLTATDYLAFAASGAVCTSLVRTALTPLDVAKTLMQSSPEAYPTQSAAFASLWAQGGLPSLYRSIDVTAVAGFLLGGFGFGVNEFLRRYLGALGGPQAQAQYPLQIAIGAALGSVIVTCLATTPFEVLRIRAIEAASADAARDAEGSDDAAAAAAAPTPPLNEGGLLASKGASPTTPLPATATAAATAASGARQLVPSDAGAVEADGGGVATAAAAAMPPSSSRQCVPSGEVGTNGAAVAAAVSVGGGGGGDSRSSSGAPVSCRPVLPASAYNAVNGLGTLYAEGGFATLYSALTPLLLRELPFSITKYLVYDTATQTIAAAFPLSQEGPLASALLSLTGGLAAGVIAAAVSTPADTLLTLSQTPPPPDENGCALEPPSMLQVARGSLQRDPLSLFNGLLPRCVFFGALIAGQFLLYDEFKSLFKVGTSDISFYLDVFASTDLPYR